MTTYIDLTMMLNEETAVWPGDVSPSVEVHTSVGEHGYQTMRLTLGSHSGTHIDAPAHLIDGAKSVDQYDISRFFARCYVLGPEREGGAVTTALVACLPTGCDGILFAGQGTFLSLDAARFLVDRGVRLYGFASGSCDEPTSTDFLVHRLLMGHDALIIENLANLDPLVGRVVDLVALPLLVEGSDGAPARVIAQISDELCQ